MPKYEIEIPESPCLINALADWCKLHRNILKPNEAIIVNRIGKSLESRLSELERRVNEKQNHEDLKAHTQETVGKNMFSGVEKFGDAWDKAKEAVKKLQKAIEQCGAFPEPMCIKTNEFKFIGDTETKPYPPYWILTYEEWVKKEKNIHVTNSDMEYLIKSSTICSGKCYPETERMLAVEYMRFALEKTGVRITNASVREGNVVINEVAGVYKDLFLERTKDIIPKIDNLFNVS